MLQNQLTKGNNGLIKRKYITFGIEADSLRMAKAKLDRIETDILNNFKTLGVKTEPLSGYERLKVLHDVFNMDSNEPFRFSFDMVAPDGTQQQGLHRAHFLRLPRRQVLQDGQGHRRSELPANPRAGTQ